MRSNIAVEAIARGLVIFCLTILNAGAQEPTFVHPPISSPSAHSAPTDLPPGMRSFDTKTMCINFQRKTRTLLAMEFERSPFSRGERMERDLSRLCRGYGEVFIGPSGEALRAEIEAYNRPDPIHEH